MANLDAKFVTPTYNDVAEHLNEQLSEAQELKDATLAKKVPSLEKTRRHLAAVGIDIVPQFPLSKGQPS